MLIDLSVCECFLSEILVKSRCLRYQELVSGQKAFYTYEIWGNRLENGKIVDDEITAH